MQLIPQFIDWAMSVMNLCPYTNRAGSGEYTDFVVFNRTETYEIIGILFANGLTPKLQCDYWFCLEDQELLFGSNLIYNTLHRKNLVMGKMINSGLSLETLPLVLHSSQLP